MFGLSFSELLVIFTVALLVLGPKQLPVFARSLGRTLAELKRSFEEIRRDIAVPIFDEPVFKEEEKHLISSPAQPNQSKTGQTEAPDDKHSS